MEYTTRYYNEFHKRNMWGFNKFEYEATQLFRQNKILEKLQKLSSIKTMVGTRSSKPLSNTTIRIKIFSIVLAITLMIL